MLKEIGEWMRLNGTGIYGSKAWTRLGEGADGKLNVLPGGKIGRDQADYRFAASDFRFTVGKDGNLYAYCMTVPADGTQLRITSLGTTANAFGKPVKSVTLLGYNGMPTSAGPRRPRCHLAQHLRLQDRARLQNRNKISAPRPA